MSFPPFAITKTDAKYLTKLQIKKAQFLFENDYFIWNEAEMYLRVIKLNVMSHKHTFKPKHYWVRVLGLSLIPTPKTYTQNPKNLGMEPDQNPNFF